MTKAWIMCCIVITWVYAMLIAAVVFLVLIKEPFEVTSHGMGNQISQLSDYLFY